MLKYMVQVSLRVSCDKNGSRWPEGPLSLLEALVLHPQEPLSCTCCPLMGPLQWLSHLHPSLFGGNEMSLP